MNYMKKRFLSFVLVLALLLTGVPMAAAAGSGFVDPTVVPEVSQESGPVSLITDTAVSEETEETNYPSGGISVDCGYLGDAGILA